MSECARCDVRQLVLAAKAGEDGAFAALVARYRPTALLIARGVCDDAELAEDAVQDAFLTAFRALPNLADPVLFGPWFATIVRNRARRLAQDGYRLRSRPLDAVASEIAAPAPSLILHEPAKEAVRALPGGIRATMILYYFHEWSVGEVAALLEQPVTTVKWQLHAGRALLRKRFPPPETP